MKNISFLFLACFISFSLIAQNKEDSNVQSAQEKIVDLTIECINTRSSEQLLPFLADDFTIAGQKGQLAKAVLKQLVSQLNETVLSYEAILSDQPLTLKYNIEYKSMGMKEGTFLFNEENKLKELTLFNMKVKTMQNDTKVEINQSNFIEIPFTMAGKLIAVQVILNGEKRTFIVDSGAPKVILNSTYIAKDEDRKTFSNTKGVSGNISGMDIETIESLDFYGIKLSNQEVVSIDMKHLEESLQTEIHGLIGYELLKEYDILFDYEDKKMTLIRPDYYDTYAEENLSNYSFDKITFKQKSHIPVIELVINEKVFNCGIDCGAETNVLQDSLFSSLENELNDKEKDNLVGADNNSKQVNSAKINQAEIGNTSFQNIQAVFSDLSHLNNGYKIALDGLIGYEILSKQKTLLSFKRKELIFIK